MCPGIWLCLLVVYLTLLFTQFYNQLCHKTRRAQPDIGLWVSVSVPSAAAWNLSGDSYARSLRKNSRVSLIVRGWLLLMGCVLLLTHRLAVPLNSTPFYTLHLVIRLSFGFKVFTPPKILPGSRESPLQSPYHQLIRVLAQVNPSESLEPLLS